jgi:hypothetical protein
VTRGRAVARDDRLSAESHYAHDPKLLTYLHPDMTIERIGDLVNYNLAALLAVTWPRGNS